MEFIAATQNMKKLDEMRRMLQAMGHTVQGMGEAGIHLDIDENAETFAENALIKARAVCAKSGKPTIADDSGLCVDAIGGAPGVKSARFAGGHGDDAANNRKLLRLLERVPYAQRTARFVCVIALAMPGGEEMTEEGECEGLIGFTKSGQNGFGYDPLFYVDTKSFAEMSDEEKDRISHRAVALKKFAQALPRFLDGGAQTAQ